MATNAYVFTGHGNEITTDFDKRLEIPVGITLVTLTECGIPTNAPHIAKVIQTLNASPELFARLGTDETDKTEKEVRAKLGQDIHIYRKGMKYPDLHYAPIGDLHPPDKGEDNYTIYAKSGVYTLPIPFTEQPEWKCGNNVMRHKPTRYTLSLDMEFAKYCPMTKGFDITAARRSFTGSVYPTGDQLEAILKAKKDNYRHPTNEEDTYIPIGDIFKKLGPGVYYWIICRGSEESELVNKIRAQSTIRQRTRKGGKKYRGRKTYRKKRYY
jgi:hypothetical protein